MHSTKLQTKHIPKQLKLDTEALRALTELQLRAIVGGYASHNAPCSKAA